MSEQLMITEVRMTPQTLAVVAGVCEEVGGVMETAEREAIGYAREYATHILEDGPRPCTRMHPKIAAAVRDVVLEQAEFAGRLPARFR